MVHGFAFGNADGADAQCLTGNDRFIAVPENWSLAIGDDGVAFAVDYGMNPITVHAIRDRKTIADGLLAQSDTIDEIGFAPIIVGDHLVGIEQRYRSSPGLCHVISYGEAAIWRIDGATAYRCPLQLSGESDIEGIAMLSDELVIGRRTFLTSACTQSTQPITIEAYAVPGAPATSSLQE
jgi:hypothetical protein